MVDVKALGSKTADSKVAELEIKRRDLRPTDVGIDILYCGICHSDLHACRNDWGGSKYPVVPGHEIVGKVKEVGDKVTKFKVGDVAAVGTLVDSCNECSQCKKGLDIYCEKGATQTYNTPDPILGGETYGGYSKYIVVDESRTLTVPKSLDLAKVGPLLCAGITVYSPLLHHGAGPGKNVAVIGLGGLGHMAVKLSAAMGADTTVFTRTPAKAEEAHKLGAHHAVISTDQKQMDEVAGKFDVIIDCVPNAHDINPYINTLAFDGTIVVVGLIGKLEFLTAPLLMQRRKLAGSATGPTKESQKLLDFCGEKNVLPETELIKADYINEAFDRMEKGDVRYRFVMDLTSL